MVRPQRFALPVTILFRLPKADRNQHIQACVRRIIASQRDCLQTDVHYCHLRFSWVAGARSGRATVGHTFKT